MRRRLLAAISWSLLIGVLAACPANSPKSVHSGQARLVTLMPTGTEVVALLGASASLVGVDDYSTFPPEVTRLPKVGSYLQPSLEAIARLRPSLVILDDVHATHARTLAGQGIRTVACALHTLDDVERALAAVGAALGVAPRAHTEIAKLRARMATAQREQPLQGLRILAIIDRRKGSASALVAAGRGSWLDELFTTMGATNALGQTPARYFKLAFEDVLSSRPDVILDVTNLDDDTPAVWREALAPYRRPAATGSAVEPRIIRLTAPYLLAPSPRVDQALTTLAQALAPPP